MLKLGKQFVTFEPSSSVSDIFFDNVNQRVCVARGNGEMGITAKGLVDKNDIISFRIRDQGKIKCLTFSTDSQIASIQRDDRSADFVFLEAPSTSGVLPEIRHVCKTSNAVIKGVQWVSDRHFVFVTDQGPELHAINSKRKSIKLVRNVQIPVNWFLSYPPSQMLLFANGNSNSSLTPFLFQNGMIHRWPKFDVDFGASAYKPKLLDHDVSIATIYGQISILVLKTNPRDAAVFESICVYQFSSSDPLNETPVLTRTLRLNLSGIVAVHVIDNLVFLHHRASAQTLVFDIQSKFTITNPGNSLPCHRPICATSVEIAEKLTTVFNVAEISLYNNSWVSVSPNLLVALTLGVYTSLNCLVVGAIDLFDDKNCLMDFLGHRTGSDFSEVIYLNLLRDNLAKKHLKISNVCDIFEHLLKPKIALQSKDPNAKFQLIADPFTPLKIDHDAIMRKVFDPLREMPEMDKTFLSYLVLEFFLTVKRTKISMENHYLPELVLNTLIDAQQFNKLQQLLQYRVIDDSKFLAFELMSLGQRYPPLYQMAIDMFSRRGNREQIAEVLIAQGKVIEAMRCCDNIILDKSLCLKILEAAWKTENRQTKYTIFTHLQSVKKIAFLDGTHPEFEKFMTEVKSLFQADEVEDAQQRFRLSRIPSSRAFETSVLNEANESNALETETAQNTEENGSTDNF
ncbi:colon cancer-associated protein mic1-like domain-containing protein [Ditylenchus destructor]|nr:colon cancer-associated protein mic1-like domain-containing protein [Ditylenchus destructor]